jgi:hypothetical protein
MDSMDSMDSLNPWSFQVDKTASKVVDNLDGTYSVDYTIKVELKDRRLFIYTLTDNLDLPS